MCLTYLSGRRDVVSQPACMTGTLVGQTGSFRGSLYDSIGEREGGDPFSTSLLIHQSLTKKG